MKNIICLLVALLISSSIVNSQTIDSTLIKAYNHNSKIILDEFFMNWENSFEINNFEFLNQNDTIKELYNILNGFYFATDTTRYFILSDNLRLAICYSTDLPDGLYIYNKDYNIIEKTITGFRPFDRINKTKFLYLNEKYTNSLNGLFPKNSSIFLDSLWKHYNLKLKFLEGYVKFYPKGSMNFPFLDNHKILTDPVIISILFNNTLDKANIYYSIGCAFLVSHYIKREGVWQLNSKITLGIC